MRWHIFPVSAIMVFCSSILKQSITCLALLSAILRLFCTYWRPASVTFKRVTRRSLLEKSRAIKPSFSRLSTILVTLCLERNITSASLVGVVTTPLNTRLNMAIECSGLTSSFFMVISQYLFTVSAKVTQRQKIAPSDLAESALLPREVLLFKAGDFFLGISSSTFPHRKKR